MKNINKADKAIQFLELHKNNKLLILPNIWDPIGARILAINGFPAVATASAAVSASQGYHDGEKIKLPVLLDIISKIVESVNIPVTVDFENGYAPNLHELEESISRLIDTGAAGLNIEDSIEEGKNLREINEQCERINCIRETANNRGIHLVINARVDTFLLSSISSEGEKIKQAINRANQYKEAGADCIYPIGAKQKDTLVTLKKNISVPINVLAYSDSLPLKTIQEIGINRISFGPFVFRSCLKKFENIIKELYSLGNYNCFSGEIMSSNEIGEYLRD